MAHVAAGWHAGWQHVDPGDGPRAQVPRVAIRAGPGTGLPLLRVLGLAPIKWFVRPPIYYKLHIACTGVAPPVSHGGQGDAGARAWWRDPARVPPPWRPGRRPGGNQPVHHRDPRQRAPAACARQHLASSGACQAACPRDASCPV
nr:hypothetical protein [Candidatus Sigynarchaeota archaeon]